MDFTGAGKKMGKSSTFLTFSNFFINKSDKKNILPSNQLVFENLRNKNTSYFRIPEINVEILKHIYEHSKTEKTFIASVITKRLNDLFVFNECKHVGTTDGRTRTGTREKQILKPTTKLLEKFCNIGILTFDYKKAERSKQDIKFYQCTYSGYFLVLLLLVGNKEEIINGKNRGLLSETLKNFLSNPYNEIYEHFQNAYGKLNDSKSIFESIFFKKCNENNLFEEYIDQSISYLKDNCDKILHVNSFMFYLFLLVFKKGGKSFACIWIETLNELGDIDMDLWDLFLYNLKLDIENRQAIKAREYTKYEVLRYGVRNKTDIIALEGQCNKCKRYCHEFEDILDYLRFQLSGTYRKTCKVCKSNGIEGIVDYEDMYTIFNSEKIGDKKYVKLDDFTVVPKTNKKTVVSFSDLFNVYSDGKISNESSLLRDILRYGYSLSENEYFLEKNLRQWLFRNHTRWKERDQEKHIDINDYKDTTETYLKKLIYLGLIQKTRKKIEHEDESVDIEERYQIAEFGRLAVLMIDFDEQEKDNQNKSIVITEKICSFFEKYFQTDPVSSRDVFGLDFFRRCKKNDVLHYQIENILKNLKFLPYGISDDIFTQLVFPLPSNHKIAKKVYKQWRKSYFNLFQTDKKNFLIFSHYIKLQLQRSIEGKVFNYSEYEKKRFETIEEQGHLILQYSCLNCKKIYPCTTIGTISYLDKIFNNMYPRCPKCNDSMYGLSDFILEDEEKLKKRLKDKKKKEKTTK